MADLMVLQGTFEDVDRAADAIEELRGMGIPDQNVSVISAMPISTHVLGRPPVHPKLKYISLIGATLGLLIGVFYTMMTPYLYTIRVGGQPIIPPPPSLILLYEFTMLFLIISTFLGLLWLTKLPPVRRPAYDPKLADGGIGVFVEVPWQEKDRARQVLESNGAAVKEPERRPL